MLPSSAPSSGIGAQELQRVMSTNPVIVDRDATLDQALALLASYGIHHLPVVECNRVIGMVSDRDLRLATGLLPAERRLSNRRGQRLSGPERVLDVMRQPVHCLPERAPVVEAARCMLRHRIGAVPVVQGESLVGIVTETDLLLLFAELRGGARGDEPARDHLRAPLTSVAPDTPLDEALQRLDEHGRYLGVLDSGKWVGLVSERDLGMGLARNAIHRARAESEGGKPPVPLCVRDVMVTRVVTVPPDTPLWRCAGRMLDHDIGALPVLSGDAVLAGDAALGILTRREILEHFASAMSEGLDLRTGAGP